MARGLASRPARTAPPRPRKQSLAAWVHALRASAEDHTYQQAATEEAGAVSAAVQLPESMRGEWAIGGACGDVASEGAALAMLLEREGDAVAEWSRSFGGDTAEVQRRCSGDAAEGDVDADEDRVDEARSTILDTVSIEELHAREIASGCSVRRSVWDADATWRVDGCRRSLWRGHHGQARGPHVLRQVVMPAAFRA